MGERSGEGSRSRRELLTELTALAGLGASEALLPAAPVAAQGTAHQAMGTRVGDAADSTAVVWCRITSAATRNNQGVVVSGRVNRQAPARVTVPVDQLEGACPGAAGRVRLRYAPNPELRDARTTPWADVSEREDFLHHFLLENLQPGTTYHYVSEATGPGGTRAASTVRGRFATAPRPSSTAPVRFCVMTCQGYHDRGHPDGHAIYPAMLRLDPHFTCLTGDLVYYDSNEPQAVTPRLARYHWERMFSLPRLVEFTRSVGTYWLKDDHDTLSDDSAPGAVMGDFTFAEGQRIFRQQAPMRPGPAYRTFRWGRDLQIWLTDGRDYRSPKTMPDGPQKTIWGRVQKEWFQRTVRESDAAWKVLVSPTPLVGPDRPQKNDNHSNRGYQHEGDELRAWLRTHVPDNFFVVCGDRHWQYHSVHPDTGLHEFSAGPASDEHAGGTPGHDPRIHRFHRVLGGFLSVSVGRTGEKPTIRFEHRDVTGQVVYTFEK
ncbi:MAG: alkaline phosphatase [Armatimonadetes bacterium]|nr:alkaline phosphatase [Armatimonadota bacterium]